MRLVYEGDFCKGVREGQGTSYEHSGEVYTGCWQQNRRMGPGASAGGVHLVHAGSTDSQHQHQQDLFLRMLMAYML
jgi:hypothetical protein